MPTETESQAPANGSAAIVFGPFRLLSAQRLLLEGDKPVRLGSRAFDLLTALVERAGELVGKEELLARAWPGTFVEEPNLKIQISALRRVLGDGQAVERWQRNEEHWLIAELLRLCGEFVLQQDAAGADALAGEYFQQSLDCARRQGALSWELRATTSFARFLARRGHTGEAIAILRPVYDRFTEGFGTADLVVAKQLLIERGTANCD